MPHEIKKSKLNTYTFINERSEFVFKRIVFNEITRACCLFFLIVRFIFYFFLLFEISLTNLVFSVLTVSYRTAIRCFFAGRDCMIAG